MVLKKLLFYKNTKMKYNPMYLLKKKSYIMEKRIRFDLQSCTSDSLTLGK